MMKKLLALLCAAMLLCGCALAEETLTVSTSFDITLTVPDGYTYDRMIADGLLLGSLTPTEGSSMPSMCLVIAFSEEYAGVTLNDMTDEQVNELIEACNQDFVVPVNTIESTVSGTKLIITHETNEASPMADITTIYRGYFITLSIFPAADCSLTDSDIQRGIDILSGTEFVDAY